MTRSWLFLAAASAAACGPAGTTDEEEEVPTENACSAHAECDGDTPVCIEGTCSAEPAGWQIGIGDGSAESVGLAWLFSPAEPRETTDIAFDPSHEDRLWILMREFETDEPCTQDNPAGCDALPGTTAIMDGPGTEQMELQVIQDPNAWHFMRRPTGIAFGAGETFATCGEHRTGNFTDGPIDFIGPTLWSSNLDVYGIQPPGKNGSHLDMLHETPWCMGIAWEADNTYWLFNGNVGAIDRAAFHDDHGPGEDDHGDGEYWRYAEGQFARVPNVPSHMSLHDGWLYIADTGNARVARLDTRTGTMGEPFEPVYDPIDTHHHMDGAVVEDVVPPGTLEQPSGLVIHEDVLFVSDYATSRIHAFDLEGKELNTLQLDLPPAAITGLEIGPEGRLYFVAKPEGDVYEIVPY